MVRQRALDSFWFRKRVTEERDKPEVFLFSVLVGWNMISAKFVTTQEPEC